MFGYVKPVIEDLLVKEHEFYKATYCGICRAMKKHTGFFSNATITYDSVLLALVRMAYIDDTALAVKRRRCIASPLRAKPMLEGNAALEYTARAFAVLTYYKLLDDMQDEGLSKKVAMLPVRPIVSGAKRRAKEPELESIAKEKLDAIGELEKSKCASVDEPAHLFGELLGEIFAGGLEGNDRLVTYQLGYHLGKFIYAADAAEDYEEDRKEGKYNPYVISHGGEPLTYENKQTIKCALLLECHGIEGALNLIPFGNKVTVENIVRNIVYEGLVKRIEFLDKKEESEENQEILPEGAEK